MSTDLISRIHFNESLGNSEPKERVYEWLKESEKKFTTEFYVNDENFHWRIISSKDFVDIIHEDVTDWLYINSENNEFKAIGKIQNGFENLIGEKNQLGVFTIWILKSDIETLKVSEKPILIWTPHNFEYKIENIEYDLKKLIMKLQNPKIKIAEFVSYKESKELKKRIR
jgi:hypothetical protein